jgi:hypothetical protein
MRGTVPNALNDRQRFSGSVPGSSVKIMAARAGFGPDCGVAVTVGAERPLGVRASVVLSRTL